MAGFPNGEITRALSAYPKPYIARAFFRQTWGMGSEKVHVEADANQLAEQQSVSRIVLTAGKLSATDFFDNNSYNHDPRGQFMNWSMMDDGAFDYPADARGYTFGAVVEFIKKYWTARVGSFGVATQANMLQLDRHFRRNNSEVADFEIRPSLLKGKPGRIEVLGFMTHANMGNYSVALEEMPVDPNIVLTRRTDTMKYGFGLNGEQSLTSDIGVFYRAGWNDGKTEDWMFTEIDRTFQAGMQLTGNRWKRSKDTLGIGCVFNGISALHREYLAAGGDGFIIGDGGLEYGKERILETYYGWNLVKYTTLTMDYQYAGNPAYNQDRGPVSILSLRMHLEF
jgi:high affinity Mn2+ porin